MTSSDLDLRLQRFRSRRDEYPHALASALIEAGRSNDALEVIHLGLLDDEANLELLTLEGRAFYVQGDLQEAQRSLLRAAKVDPRHKEPYRWLAQVLIERGDAVRAVQVLERAIGLDPNDAALRQSYARAQRMAGAAGGRKDSVKPAPAAPAPTRSVPAGAGSPALSAPPARSKSTPPASGSSPARERPSQREAPEAPAARKAASARELPTRETPAPARARASEPRQPSVTPSALGPAVQKPPANQNGAKRGAISDLVARAGALRARAKAKPDLVAEDMLREPPTNMGLKSSGWVPPTERTPESLPFGEDTERDDESPTTAVEVPEEVRSWLRSGQPRPSDRAPNERPSERSSHRPQGASERPRPREQVLESDDDDDESSVPTSIVPATEELEALRRIEAQQAAQSLFGEQDEGDATLIGDHRDLAAPGQAEPPEQVLHMLQTQGVFESDAGPAPAPQVWLGTTELPFVGTPIRRALAIAWGLAILAALAGYFGFQSWLDERRAQASTLLASARLQALDGQHASWLQAERTLNEARALDPKSEPALRALLFVTAARAFDEGSGDLGPLRTTLARAQQSKLEAPIVGMASVLTKTADQRKRELDTVIALADRAASHDPEATYVAARIAQHAGQLEATQRLLARAVSLEPQLAVAQVALGEQARASGELERAVEAFRKALGPDHEQLRAELWLSVLEAKPDAVAVTQSKLDGLMPRVERGSDADKLLAYAARAFAAQAAGNAEQAKQALRLGSALHVDDPELLAFFSEQALRAGEHTLSYRAARAASEAGGDAPRFQPLIAAALLQQGDGDAALTALANVGEGHGALALARASAALLTDSRESLEAAKKELASYRTTPVGRDDVEASALLLRVDLRLGANVEALFPAARALVARAPSNAAAHLALGEAQLAAGQGSAALQALEPALKLAPGSADAHYLMGRAQRLAGKPTEARASFERAVAVAPNHVEAQRALGRSLLDAGDFDAALALFRALETTAGSSATLGVIEALIDKRSESEATARFDALAATVKATPTAQQLLARLELLRGNPLDAVKTLEPIVAEDAESRTTDSLALYGGALYAADRVDPAAGAYDAALELDENNPDALIGRAVTAVRASRPDPALALLARADGALGLRARPASVRALWMLTEGRAELQKNQLASALEHLARATALPGVPSESFFWYGEALAKSKSDQANAQYARYLELEPNGLYAARARRALGSK
ncbi:MAG: Vegetative cell wall protein gp1 precursor [Myxococcaceae bacterium]|nr:Vegetative cell wall protein gp1 precursor [Myxococcaceae bacterium]